MKRNKKILISIIVICFLAAIIFNMDKKNSPDAKYSKVLIIGIDGMDFDFTNTLIQKGKLKNFEKISKSGTFSKLGTTYPPETPVAWTSMATGKNPGKHGIFDYIKRNPANYIPELSTSKVKNTIFGTRYLQGFDEKAFWEYTSKEDIPTTIIRWPITFPPNLKGKMISGLGVPDIRGNLAGYTIYSSVDMPAPEKPSNKLIRVDLKNNTAKTEIIGPYLRKGNEIINANAAMKLRTKEDKVIISVNGKDYEVKEKNWSEWIEIEFRLSALRKVNGIAKAYVLSIDPLKIYLTAVHIDPANPLLEISKPKSYSKELSNNVGLFSTLGMPEETDGYIEGNLDKEGFLMLIDDLEKEKEKVFWHEFNEFKKNEKGAYAFVFDASDRLQHVMSERKKLYENEEVVDYYLKKDEFLGKVLDNIGNDTLLLVVSDHGFSTFERAVSINNWLIEKGFMKIKGDMDNAGPLFKNVLWNETKAYSLGFSSIYINEKGREAEGIVEDKENMISEIISELKELKDSDGKKVLYNAYRREEIYAGKHVDDAPDIIVGFNPGFRMGWQNAIGGFSPETIMDNDKKWKGDHLIDPFFVPGIVFSNAKFNSTSASLIDIAPTVLHALGIEPNDDIDGKSLLD